MSKRIIKEQINSGGKYKTNENYKILKPYQCWSDIFKRCYKSEIKDVAYNDCFISDSWIDYQDFAKWFYSLSFYEVGWHLDKDIIVRGNKEYGPETCCFVPRTINNLFTLRKNFRGTTPNGVVYHERLNKYEARCTDGTGKMKYYGVYETCEEAFIVFKHHKEALIKSKANQYKDLIDPRCYNSLMSWEVMFDD